MKLVATKAGGHSVEALAILDELPEAEWYGSDMSVDAWVFTDCDDFQDYCVPVFESVPWRTFGDSFSLKCFFRNLFDSLKVLLKLFPDEVFCCGANNSLFVGFFGMLLGARVVAVEANNRVREPSKAVKILSFFCDEVWVPFEELVGKYRGKAVCRGFVHPVDDFSEFESEEKDIDCLSVLSSSEVGEGVSGLSHEEVLSKLGRTKRAITRGGMAAWEAAHLCDEVVVYPIEGSHENHQEDFAVWLANDFDNVEVVMDD